MRLCSIHPLASFRRHCTPAGLVRALWLAVILLHVVLLARRVALGLWSDPLDILRGVLCLGGAAYGLLKFRRVAILLDSSPRRALAFALILLLGHWLIVTPTHPADPQRPSIALTAILASAPSLGAALLLLEATQRRNQPQAECHFTRQPCGGFDLAHLPLAIVRRSSCIYHRPPPQS